MHCGVVLLVEDDGALARGTARHLTRRGFLVRVTGCLAGARWALCEERFDAIVMDYSLPDGTSMALLGDIVGLQKRPVTIVLSGYVTAAMTVEMVKRGADDVLSKPCDIESLIRRISAGRAATVSPARQERMSLARAEREYIAQVMRECGGNISQAARELGLHRQSLQRKLRKHVPS